VSMQSCVMGSPPTETVRNDGTSSGWRSEMVEGVKKAQFTCIRQHRVTAI
jgi:hypothetical protein